jgi:WD40 repeat protein
VKGQISWSPDSSQIFVFTKAGLTNEVYVYDVETKSFTLFLDVRSLGATYDTFFDLSPNGSLLALPNDSTYSIGFWDLTPQLIKLWTQNAFENPENACVPSDWDFTNIATIKWSPDGNILALGSNSTAGLDLCILLDSNLVTRHLDSVATYAVDWSPDGKYLASGTFQWDDLGVGCEIRLFDVENNFEKSIAEIEQDVCSVFSIAWAPDSEKISVATNHGLWIGEVSELSEHATKRHH